MIEDPSAPKRPIRAVGIAICTYRRPELLRALLASIAEQRFDGPAPEVSIAVADNSPDREGMPVALTVSTSFPYPIIVDHEPQPGIATTRNRTVSMLGPQDAIVFIDDDETAAPDWLAGLVRTAETYDADVVCGPVFARFAETPSRWMIDGRFYERERHPTGTVTGATATSNLLVRDVVFRALEQPFFDPALGLIGCDDTLFLERARLAGHVAVWCDEAVVSETFPVQRLNTRWLVQRKFRGGNSWVIIQRMLRPGARTTAVLIAKALMRVVASIVVLPATVWRPVPRVRTLQSLALGSGQIVAFVNIRYSEYRRPKGVGTG